MTSKHDHAWKSARDIQRGALCIRGACRADVGPDRERKVRQRIRPTLDLPRVPCRKPIEIAIQLDMERLLGRADSSALDASAMAFYTPELGIATSRPELARRAVAGHPESWLAWQMVADATRPGDPAQVGVVVAKVWEGLGVVCASRNDPSPPAR